MIVMLVVPAGAAGADRFNKIYAKNDKAALTEWGRRYENGEGVSADVDRAIRLYCKAARQGYADAQYQLGWLYAHGRGVKRDDALAAAWFKKAASRNHAQARNVLRLLKVKPKSQASCPTNSVVKQASRRSYRPRTPPAHVKTMVHRLAPEFRLDPDIVLAVVQVESNFDSSARSPKNAQGLMQLIPATADRFGVNDVWDPEQNLRGGMAYLRWLLDRFDGDLSLALAGYNAGEGAVDRHQGIPPYEETREYVRRVTGLLGR
jgi:soluble lytic murein transglycosylase-like protein